MRMRATVFFGLALAVAALVFLGGGCSEDEPVRVDEMPPVVQILNPIASDQPIIQVTDSVTIVVAAEDESGIAYVEVWCSFHNDTTATQLGVVDEPDSSGQYRYFWMTAGFDNGAEGVLWATAVDGVGNKGRNPIDTSIRVINSEDVGPPVADFFVVPSQGTVDILFTFDPSPTTDDLADLGEIVVRWDFNGDGIWEIDTTDNKTAQDRVTYQFSAPANYLPKMQAFNDYYPAGSNIAERLLMVTPEFGEPNPPEGQEYLRIPAGVYPLGVVRLGEGQGTSYDNRELVDDTLYVSVSSDFNIDKYEVTNALYVNYLNQARSEGEIEYISQQRIVVNVESQDHLITLDGAASRIRYASEQLGFLVGEEYVQHPVTGVTWRGAHAYASYYGLRLPSEVEWEIAARTNHIDTNLEPRYIYPWVPPDTIDGAFANYRNSGDPFEEEGNQRATTPVGAYNGGYIGSFPTNDAVGPFDTYDQAGNVAEWVNDWYDEAVYQELLDHYLSTGSPKTDPRGPRDGTHKVYRGGSFYSTTDELRITQRRATPPDEVSARLGFRTAHAALN